MVVVVEPVLAVVADKEIGPAVIVIIRHRAAVSPAIVRHTGLLRYFGESSVMIVVEQCRVWRFFLSIQRIECRAVHEIDIEPAIVVEVDQADARTIGLNKEVFLWHAHFVAPATESGLLRGVFEDDRSLIAKPAGRDGSILRVVNRSRGYSRGDPSPAARLSLLFILLGRRNTEGNQKYT